MFVLHFNYFIVFKIDKFIVNIIFAYRQIVIIIKAFEDKRIIHNGSLKNLRLVISIFTISSFFQLVHIHLVHFIKILKYILYSFLHQTLKYKFSRYNISTLVYLYIVTGCDDILFTF